MSTRFIEDLPRYVQGYVTDSTDLLHAIGGALGLPSRIVRRGRTPDSMLPYGTVQIGEVECKLLGEDVDAISLEGPEHQIDDIIRELRVRA